MNESTAGKRARGRAAIKQKRSNGTDGAVEKEGGAQTASRQRRLQAGMMEVDAVAAPTVRSKQRRAVQAGSRRQPVRMTAQQVLKPGSESELELAPRYMAPDYRGSGKLQGLRAIITGADSGIGRAVAVLFAREGADVAVLYLSEHEDATLTCERIGPARLP